jgi:hypothetical protein
MNSALEFQWNGIKQLNDPLVFVGWKCGEQPIPVVSWRRSMR